MWSFGLLLVSVATVSVLSDNEVFNYAEDYKFMSTLSTYEKIRGDIATLATSKYCTPVKLWVFQRHGTRYPSQEEIPDFENLAILRDQILENHALNRGSLTNDQLKSLQGWSFDPSILNVPFYLTASGFNESKRIANRFKRRFPNLLNKPYSAEDFYFQHSDTQRTAQTSYAFIDEFFGDNAHQTVAEHVDPASQDFLLYPFGGVCPKLSALYANVTYLIEESIAFQSTSVYTKVLWRLSRKLGFSTILPAGTLVTIFGACAYDLAWNQETTRFAPWCVAVDTEARIIVEYLRDLQFQRYSGDGTKVTARVGCGPVADLWQRFATATGEIFVENKAEGSTFLFSHDIQLLLVQTSLGLNIDDPSLSSDNFPQQKNRLFRTSTLAPFAGNLAAVLHECRMPKGSIEYEVLLLRNEQRWKNIPGCPNGVCKWKAFRNLVKSVSDNCKIEEIC